MEQNPPSPIPQENLQTASLPSSPPPPNPVIKRKFPLRMLLGILLAFLLLTGIAAGFFVLNSQTTNTGSHPTPTVTPSLTPIPTPTIKNILSLNATESGPTENWNQYINETFNYSFRYPNGWEISGEADKNDSNLYTNEIKKPQGPTISFSTGIVGVGGGPCNTDPNLNLGYEEISVFNTVLPLYFIGDKQNDSIGYASVGKYSTACPGGSYLDIAPVGYIDNDGKRRGLDSLSVSYGRQVKTNEFNSPDFEIAKKIISTFKVINDPTVDWKTFTSPDTTFSFKYPSNWTLKTDPAITLYPPETDFNFPAQGLDFRISSDIFPKAHPTPSVNMTTYQSVSINGYYGRQTEDDKAKNPIGRVGGCPHFSYIYFPTSDGTLEISMCQPRDERYDEILSTIEFYK